MDERSPSKHKELTIAMGMDPRVSGVAPRAELSEILDAINLMSYDYNGAWLPFVAHNAPLFEDPDGTAAGGAPEFNIDWGVQLWLEDVAPSKLVLGLPAYGRGWLGANQEYAQAPGEFGAGSPISGTYEEGLVSYYDIKANYDSNPAWTKGWNAASKVPFYYRSSPASFVSFDEDCLSGSGRRSLAASVPTPWSSKARAAVAAPLALAAVAGLAVYGRRHRASQASNLADIESCAEEA